MFGLSHATLGKRMAKNWGFPDSLANAIGNHHQLNETDELPVAMQVAALIRTIPTTETIPDLATEAYERFDLDQDMLEEMFQITSLGIESKSAGPPIRIFPFVTFSANHSHRPCFYLVRYNFVDFLDNLRNYSRAGQFQPANFSKGVSMHINSPEFILISDTVELGRILRAKRKAQQLTQTEVAQHCGLSLRFVSEVERGKPTAEVGKVLHLLQAVGVDLFAAARE